jgi:hypothetical protein
MHLLDTSSGAVLSYRQNWSIRNAAAKKTKYQGEV